MAGSYFMEDGSYAGSYFMKDGFDAGSYFMKDGFDGRLVLHGGRLQAGRRGEREPPAAHTLTAVLSPTTCVVVNKPSGL